MNLALKGAKIIFARNFDCDQYEILFTSETMESNLLVENLNKKIHVRWRQRGAVSEGGPVDGNGWGFAGTEGMVSDKYVQLLSYWMFASLKKSSIVSVLLANRLLLRLPLKLWTVEWEEFVRSPQFFVPVNPSLSIFSVKLFGLNHFLCTLAQSMLKVCKSAKLAFVLQYYRTNKTTVWLILEIAW